MECEMNADINWVRESVKGRLVEGRTYRIRLHVDTDTKLKTRIVKMKLIQKCRNFALFENSIGTKECILYQDLLKNQI